MTKKSVLEAISISDEFRQICMDNSSTLLLQGIQSQQILRIVVPYLFQRAVFALLGLGRVREDIHGNLDIRIGQGWTTQDEVDFKTAYPSYTYFVAKTFSILIDNVFQYRAIRYAVVCVAQKVEAQVRQVVFFTPS